LLELFDVRHHVYVINGCHNSPEVFLAMKFSCQSS
jgi:hypothetical protein